MRAVVTVIGQDKIGIISNVTEVLAKNKINILDINQTIMQDVFTMLMLVDTSDALVSFDELQNRLEEKGQEIGVAIKIQHEGIFNAMSEL